MHITISSHDYEFYTFNKNQLLFIKNKHNTTIDVSDAIFMKKQDAMILVQSLPAIHTKTT